MDRHNVLCKFCGNSININKLTCLDTNEQIYCTYCNRNLDQSDLVITNQNPRLNKLSALSPEIVDSVKLIGLKLLDADIIQVNKEDVEDVRDFARFLNSIGSAIMRTIVEHVKERYEQSSN